VSALIMPAKSATLDRAKNNIAALMNPRSIALVGASARAGSLAERPLANLLRHGYTGRILPVNPRYEQVGDFKCYPDLKALDEVPDAVLVLTGADQIFATLDQAAEVGARSAILFAGGFAETGEAGVALQAKLTAYAARGLRLCGPNCNGLFNISAGIAMGFSAGFELPARKGHVALISQSGAIATGVSSRAMEQGVGFSHVIATGNEADLEVSDFVEHLLEDPEVACFALYVEGLKDPARFLSVAARALEAGKPIVMLSAGRSAAGQKVALSHTGAMAGSYDVIEGALLQRGVQVVQELDDLISLAAMFGVGRKPGSGGALAVTSLSGGMAALIADECDAVGAPLATFGPETQAALGKALPNYASLSNPLDVTGQVVNQPSLWTACLEAVSADPAVDTVLNILSITANLTEVRFAADIVAQASHPGKAFQLCLWTSGAPKGSGVGVLRDAGVPVFLRADGAIRALDAWRRYWETRDPRAASLRRAADAVASIQITQDVPPSGWDLLAESDVPVARQALITERADLAARLEGFRFPVVFKVESANIAHKTELGLVRLGVGSLATAEKAFDEMTAIVAALQPRPPIDGILVQEMIAGKRELILGARHESGLPPVVVLGVGGVFSEIISDIAIRLAPLTPFDVEEMVAALRMRAMLGDARGLGPLDMRGLTDLVVRFSHLAWRYRDVVAEMEINPLIVSDDGRSITAVDVLIAPHLSAGV
jgi:acyl-CoA synthetase (NDP forming)